MKESAARPVHIGNVMTGPVAPFGPAGEPSGFRKSDVCGAVVVGPTGLAGDAHADLEHHGGPEKAILHYAFDHYARWREERPELTDHLARPGAFGENVSTTGLTEDDVCIGDCFRLGSASVEISQGRQPCWKLGHRFREPTMVREVIRTGRCGWYYRVLETGAVAAGDTLALLERPYPEWTVARVFGLIVGPARDREALAALITLLPLSASWLGKARRRWHNAKAGHPDTG